MPGERISARKSAYQRALVDFSKGMPITRLAIDLGYAHQAPEVKRNREDLFFITRFHVFPHPKIRYTDKIDNALNKGNINHVSKKKEKTPKI